MLRPLLLAMLAASATAFMLPGGARVCMRSPAASVRMQADDKAEGDGEKKEFGGVKGSSLTISREELAARNEKKQLVNRLLPLAVISALLFNVATDGAVGKLDLGLPTPPGMEEARAIKARSDAKSKEAYKKAAESLAGRAAK